MLDLRKVARDYEKSARSFAELVPWMAQIAPHMVINKDGSLLVCYTYDGLDAEGQEQYEIDRATRLLEHALRSFDERNTVWFTVDRRKAYDYPKSSFTNEISTLVDEVWKDQFTKGDQYVNRYYLAILYSPSSGVDGFFEKIAHYTKNEGMTFIAAISEAIKSSVFKRAAFTYETSQLESFINDFENQLGAFDVTAGDLEMRQLVDDELLGYLHARCSPASQDQKVKRPSIPAYLDSYLTSDQLQSRGDSLLFRGKDDVWLSAISVKDWPDLTNPGLLDDILAVPGELTFSQVFRYSAYAASKKMIVDKERHNRNMEKSLKSYIMESFTKQESKQRDTGRVMMAEDAHDALTEMTTENRTYGYYNLTIMTYGETRQESEGTLRILNQVLMRRGFISVRENMHLLSAYCGTMPGQAGALVRWFFVSTANLSDLAPVRTLSIGQKTNPYFNEQYGMHHAPLTVLNTEFAIPYYFNFHQGDLAHTLVVGPSRTGKSSFNNFLISQFQKYTPCHTFIFDKDYSCRIPTILQGGTHVDLAGDHANNVSINPMILLENPEDWPWLARWLEILITARGYEITADDERDIWRVIELAAAQPKEQWRLVTLGPLLPTHLHTQMQQWIGEGQKSRYFDNPEDTFDLGHFTCIEMGGLFADEVVARAFMEYAFYRVAKKLDGRPALIYIEEAWFMLAEKKFAQRINDWLRTLAKKNAFLIMATQSLDEIARSDIFATIIDNIPNRVYLANPNAYAHREMYKEQFGLNDTQIERVRNAIPKIQYYIVTPRLSRMAECRLPPEILAVVRSDARAQKVFTKHLKSEQENWKDAYLEEMVHG